VPVDLDQLLTDLQAETTVVDEVISDLSDAEWGRETPAVGWTVGDQVTHLSYFDDVTVLAAADPAGFRPEAEHLEAHGPDFARYIAAGHKELPPAERLAWFRGARSQLIETLSCLDARTRLPWFGPDMSVASAVTARLMETWAHGQDIADALAVDHPPSMRLHHIAHLGVRTFGFAFELHGMDVPATPVRVELVAPDGSMWCWGESGATDLVAGSALDFCLVVTQRRHLLDTSLMARGPVAAQWLVVAQAFAGPPGFGRRPLSGGAADVPAQGTER
jgi:uncharacterized protein (TIGR03084 family)